MSRSKTDVAIEFRRAGLPMSFAQASDFRGLASDSEIFLCDIRTRKRPKGKNHLRRKLGGQELILRRGKGNTIRVTDVDKHANQLVLAVQEPQRSFQVTEKKWSGAQNRYISVTRTETTQGELRAFLIGIDEGHLFMAQLPTVVRTCKSAYRLLRPASLGNTGNFLRQGEWFFTSPTAKELEAVEAALKEPLPVDVYHKIGLQGDARAGRTQGRPHVADEVVRVKGKEFCRGAVRHPDHKTRRFHSWKRVRKNEEKASTVKGQSWVD